MAALWVLGCLWAFGAAGETMHLPSFYATLDFAGDWHVFTPASVMLYEVMLREEAGLDASQMLERYQTDGVQVEGFSEDYDQNLRLIVTEDARSASVFDLDQASKATQRSVMNVFTDASQWRLTHYRYQEASWSIHPTMGRFLFLRYNWVEDGEITARGIQYFTIRNGKNYILETTLTDRRFTNKDVTWFKQQWQGFAFTEILPVPPPPVALSVDGGLPAETGTGALRIEGSATPSAALTLLISGEGEEAPQVLAEGKANREGAFALSAQIEAPGAYQLTLIAQAEGMEETQVGARLLYEAGLLPVTLSELPEAYYYFSTLTISGSAPAGAEIQLLMGEDLRYQRVGKNGLFSFDIDTSEEGTYDLLLMAMLENHQPRRFPITFTRVYTEDELLQQMMDSAVTLRFRQMVTLPQEYENTVVKVTGRVIDETQGDGVAFLRLYITREDGVWKDRVSLRMPSLLGYQEGQSITFYARMELPYVEQDENGQEQTVPTMELLWLAEQ